MSKEYVVKWRRGNFPPLKESYSMPSLPQLRKRLMGESWIDGRATILQNERFLGVLTKKRESGQIEFYWMVNGNIYKVNPKNGKLGGKIHGRL